MGKIIALVFFGMIGTLILSSCKKNYTCECISFVRYQGYSSSTAARSIKYGMKKDVKKSCENGSQTGEDYEIDCKIK